MPIIIYALYFYLRIFRRAADDNVPIRMNWNQTQPKIKPNEWDKLMNHPFNEYEW